MRRRMLRWWGNRSTGNHVRGVARDDYRGFVAWGPLRRDSYWWANYGSLGYGLRCYKVRVESTGFWE